MRVFRIAKSRYIRDLTGVGPQTHGGRWNHKGTAVIYASESRSLASLEYLVHIPMSLEPLDLAVATLVIPDRIVPTEIGISYLPQDWKVFPAPSRLADMGTKWAQEGESLLLRVPSAVVPDEYNILINPLHPDIVDVDLEDVHKYVFDERLLKRK